MPDITQFLAQEYNGSTDGNYDDLGCYPGEPEYHLYLIDEGYVGERRPVVLAIREAEDEDWDWEYLARPVNDVSEDDYDVLQEAVARAAQEGLIPPSDPRVETGRVSTLQFALPDTLHGVQIQSRAVYLGGSKVSYRSFELFVVPPDGAVPAIVYATAVRDMALSSWYQDGSCPDASSNADIALREAIRRARCQGFEFSLHEVHLERLQWPDVTSEPTQLSTTQKGPEANMTKPPSDAAFEKVRIVESPDEIIHLPKGMSHAKAREWLLNDERRNEQEISWTASFDAYPLDGALALGRVLERRFGSAIKAGATAQTMFGSVEVPPYMVEVQVGVGQVQHVPWGHFTIPILGDQRIEAGVEHKENQLFFRLTGKVRRKHTHSLDEIAEQIREELRANSIYKGKAFRVKFPTADEMAQRAYDPNDFAPKFINVAGQQEQLILSATVNEQVETNLFTVVKHTARCRELGIPLKRGVLLAGKYGTGKTLTASLLSRLCVENGWTFVYLENVDELDRAMRFATRYAPAVIFSEDIDQSMEQKHGSARDRAMNDILNTIDGVDMKSAELMVVLTTNFITNINKAMLRPGRLDAVISIDPPDEAAVIRLMRHYAKGLLDGQSDEALRPAASQLVGQIPAVIREVVERSKLASVARAGDTGAAITLVGEDLRIAATGMLGHINLLEETIPDVRSDLEKAADTLVDGLVRVAGVNRAIQSLNGTNKPEAARVTVEASR